MTPSRRVAVAMSGGVDSSVAAALLTRDGEAAFGLMLRLWSAGSVDSNRCCTPADVARARKVASQLGLPFYVLDVKDAFKKTVVDPFIYGYAQGLTPNPCLACNRHIRWTTLLEHALAMGATHLATGHYARLRTSNGQLSLLRAIDRSKDQSYVLSILSQEQLQHALFPLGDYTKPEVRTLADELDLATADRPESQDLCFLGEMDYRSFLETQQAGGLDAGPILNTAGERLGTHQGLARYTIGQRKGIGISAAEPYYVMQKRVPENELIVGTREQLGRTEFSISETRWISGEVPSSDDLVVRVRYKAPEVAASLERISDQDADVKIAHPLPDITPGQQAVFYSGEVCLGGGMILP
ncbi:MAG: tRNA 2-thiouridine(34) synthase MnmA [Anaerolineales bacterium]|jgi:tRNA-specific 2-thiouridylase